MKPVRDMTRLELAGFVAAEFRRRNISVVLSGGSCVSIYSRGKYVSMDLDFVNVAFTKRDRIRAAMESLGFREENRYFRHPDTDILIEFPPGPLGIGEEPVKQIVEMETGAGTLRIISPTDYRPPGIAGVFRPFVPDTLDRVAPAPLGGLPGQSVVRDEGIPGPTN